MISTIAGIHETRGHNATHQYEDRCDKCVVASRKELPCDLHYKNYVRWRTGDPCTHPYVTSVKFNAAHLAADHVTNGDSPLLPDEVAAFREYCLAKNNIYYLMLWVMTLISIKLFLRAEEAASERKQDPLGRMLVDEEPEKPAKRLLVNLETMAVVPENSEEVEGQGEEEYEEDDDIVTDEPSKKKRKPNPIGQTRKGKASCGGLMYDFIFIVLVLGDH